MYGVPGIYLLRDTRTVRVSAKREKEESKTPKTNEISKKKKRNSSPTLTSSQGTSFAVQTTALPQVPVPPPPSP